MDNTDYDVVVIGGGAAGLTAAGFAANLGAKTMMIEQVKLGGDCTWTGCVPSKILLKAAKVAHQMRRAGKYGLIDTEPEIDFQKLIQHVYSIREDIYEESDAPPNFEAMGIDVVQGQACFRDDHTVAIKQKNAATRTVTSRYFFICTGASPAVPSIEGLYSVDYLTSESLFDIEKLPDNLIIIGAGPVGTEMAQAMNRLGARVTIVDRSSRILGNDDPELAAMLRDHLQDEGVNYVLNAAIEKVSQQGEKKQLSLTVNGESVNISGDVLLLATGRQPNVHGLNLEAAGINHSEKGIAVNLKCRTNVSHIYACGDITGEYFFTHMSSHMAKVAVSNALLKLPMKVDAGHVPWCTYCDPELAHVGQTGDELRRANIRFETYRFPYAKLDRAVVESEETGMIKVFARKWSGKILGISILGARAGELIAEYAVAMKNSVSLRDLSGTIHPYPSFGEGARRAADQWYIQRRPAWLIKLIKTVFRYRGKVPEMDEDQGT